VFKADLGGAEDAPAKFVLHGTHDKRSETEPGAAMASRITEVAGSRFPLAI
jgi:hypothetical protein